MSTPYPAHRSSLFSRTDQFIGDPKSNSSSLFHENPLDQRNITKKNNNYTPKGGKRRMSRISRISRISRRSNKKSKKSKKSRNSKK